MFFKKSVLKILEIFTGKHLYWIIFLKNKILQHGCLLEHIENFQGIAFIEYLR